MSIVLAILAKDKAHCLPLYLQCIYNQTFPKKKIHLYIRTNDNSDNTAQILHAYIQDNGHKYASVFYDDTDISSDLKRYKQHEWNPYRFKLLGKLRQESIDYAKRLQADYFVADCDNFIVPNVLETFFALREFGVVAPMLMTHFEYSNFHYEVNANGYMKSCPQYWDLLKQSIKGVTIVPVVHCTYYIHEKHLSNICYDDSTKRHEYVIFSETLRKQNIDQYLDNRRFYGFLVFSETKEELEALIESKWKHMIETEFSNGHTNVA